MHTLVVYCHPWEGSFNHAVLEAVVRRLERSGEGYDVIDLYADGFEPALSPAELSHYNEGVALDPLVGRYQQFVAAADRLEIVCPIWWNDIPAMLRGFIDKVMLVGFSWRATGKGLLGTLTGIRTCDLWTTSAEPTEHLELALRSSFIEGTLAQLGIGALPDATSAAPEASAAPEVPTAASTRRWHNFGLVDASTPESRGAWLREVEGL